MFVARRRALLRLLIAVATASVAVSVPGSSAAQTQGQQSGDAEWTMGYGNQRTNWDDDQPRLGPDSVTSPDFGKIFDTTLPGTTASAPNQVYAQPVVADGVLVVATEENQVAGLDPGTGVVEWQVSLGTPWTPTSCGDLLPHVGITSTPVYDAASDSIYVAAKTADTDGVHYRLHALDPASGAERPGWPVTIAGRASNGDQTFDATTANQRTGLLLLDGSVYLGFASHCDQGAYVGYVIGVSTTTRTQSIWSVESELATSEGGIWQSGGALMSDGPGRIFVATGNGVSPAPGPGTAPPGTLAESVVRLAVGGSGQLSAADFFSPADNAKLDQNDSDFGGGGPIALPDAFGTPSHPHLMLQAGKDGVVRLLDRDNLGGMAQGAGGTDADLGELQLARGVWGRFAAFASTAGNYAFLLPSTSPLRALRIAPNAQGVPALSSVATSTASYPYTSGSPIVTSDGQDPSTAVIWVVTCDQQTGTNAVLQAYGMPTGAAWQPIASFPVGTVAKFVQPATYDGRIYVATRDGHVLAFGRPIAAAVNAPATDFGAVPVGQTSAPQDVTITASADVTIDGVTTSAPYAVAGEANLDLPVTLEAGQTLAVPVTFAPAATGAASGYLTVTARTDGPDDTYQFALNGIGTADGLAVSPAGLDFGQVSTGMHAQLGVIVQNTGASGETIQSVTAPAAPFSLVDAGNLVGTTLSPQQSVSVTVDFAPAAAGPAAGSLVIAADKGQPVTVPLQGVGVTGSGRLSLDTTQLNFGTVAPGQQRSLSFVLTNSGTANLNITKAAPPVAPFSVAAPISEGQTLQPGDSLTVSVMFRPISAEPAQGLYLITGDDGQGSQTVAVSGNDAPPRGAASTPLGCLELAGGVTANGTLAVSSPCGAVTRQQFAYDGGYHNVHFASTASTWCLDVSGASTALHAKVQFYTCNHTSAQEWLWRDDNSLYNPHARKCLDVTGGSTAAKTPLQLYTCNRTNAQYWDLSQLLPSRGEASIAAAAVGQLCLDVRGGRAVSGTAVQIYRCNLSPAQIITRSGNALRLLGNCVDLIGAGTANHTHVQLYRCNGTPAQQWLQRSGYMLYNPNSGKCLDDPGATTTLSTQLEIYQCNETPSQHWYLDW